MSIPLNTDDWAGKYKGKTPANTDVDNFSNASSLAKGERQVIQQLNRDLMPQKNIGGNKKPVSKLLGVDNSGLGAIGPFIGYSLVGIGIGLYTGKTLGGKTRRALLFGFVTPFAVILLAQIGDGIFGTKSDKRTPQPVRKKVDSSYLQLLESEMIIPQTKIY